MAPQYPRFPLLSSTVLAFTLALSSYASAAPWLPTGPEGGDARAFAGDPTDHLHIYLGTLTGWIYDTHDGGKQWTRLARVGQRDDLVLDNIVVDPSNSKHLVIGAHVIDRPDGGIYSSMDSGKSWTSSKQMQGHSVLALSFAPSDPKILIAGALDGVYRSTDGGNDWKLITPAGSMELHEIESIAIDPKDPSTIYAGTWHLPWKTSDGGANWHNIKEGIIDDSDVFSIIVDPKNPQVVYASACSGIYKSDSAGVQFKKVQGIPSTARRTRVLMQDPTRSDVVFAGTTEGLFRTADSGKTWVRNTANEVIVNDVFVDPKQPDHVLLATDRGGIVIAEDGGFSFHASNNGFSARQITAFAAGHTNPSELAVGVVNDKTFGGVFTSTDGGIKWAQQSDGLVGRDVFALTRTAEDTLLAGTSHGIFRLEAGKWKESGLLLSPVVVPPVAPPRRKGAPAKKAPVARRVPPPPAVHFDGAVYAFASSGNTIYAAAGDNVVVSPTGGIGWQTVEPLKNKEWRNIAVQGTRVVVGGLKVLALSSNSGADWHEIPAPPSISLMRALSMDDTGSIWVGGREGLVVSKDDGATWTKVHENYLNDVNNIFFDKAGERILVTNNRPTLVYAISVPAMKFTYMESGWNLRFVRPVGDHLVGATFFDGIVLQPRMMDSPVVTASK
ncbi:WD40/YVTN/BNR-like repeat-containing protein [Terriglobus saanensis]|uniref:BNR/Asp-box repeat domain/two component regulator propeller n=1 Tax=Terriglobus saanensis (strain ATCC BAA-1853 / DSM 23119 / SP1PR4) TaxID=401053 RepID=E8V8C6_TERSS|nr:hypothetical protein [Terriglobus saanensis]ADV81829.1 BNR/Asp-box repeat domain/two component regulator propeller [Terriglobus saanensis SP1PR4]